MATNVFISYRRDDTIGTAGRIFERLVTAFGRRRIFMDVDSIPAGVNFIDHIQKQVSSCKVLLAVIGPLWLDARDITGARRLDNPEDFVVLDRGAGSGRS